MNKIIVFGNPYLAQDNFALAVAQCMKTDREVLYCTSPEEILEIEDSSITILDVVKNLREPQIITLDQLKARKIISLHDFDVGFFLRLLDGLGISKDIKVIGLPQQGNASELAKEVQPWIQE